MVNFDSDLALNVPISDVKRMLILESRDECKRCFVNMERDGVPDQDERMKVRASIIGWFMEIEMILQEYFPSECVVLKEIYDSKRLEDMRSAQKILEKCSFKITDANREAFL